MKFSSIQMTTWSDGRHRQKFLLIALTLAGLIALVAGWRLFWFMTDDAYIAFRYISNSRAGFGYTWNLPPFRPVEGYTSFLWVLLLDGIWRLTGFAPPESANVISLVFALGTLLLGIYMVWRLPLQDNLARHRPWLLLFFLIGVLTNRTFLAWSSSGLETAMFNFFVIAWLCVCFYAPTGTLGWMGGLVALAVLAALTRPDGLLFIAASLFLSGWSLLRLWQSGRFHWSYLLAWSPLLLTLMHFLWRKSKYGEWLPNTFAAKYVAPWPESGWRYLLSFVIEYALWFWLVLLGWVVLVNGRHLLRQIRQLGTGETVAPPRVFIVAAAVAALLAHFAYYTFIIGGDYFEYRVYSHLIIPLYLSLIWLLNVSRASARVTAVFCLLFLFCSWVIPWTHWQAAAALADDPNRAELPAQIAAHFPRPIRPYFAWYDELQSWLTSRRVAIRHHQHKWFFEYQTSLYPPREVGARLAAEQHPVIVLGAVGVGGWMLPTTNIIDKFGLNDYVIARNPAANRSRSLAHDRYLPIGYAECFAPNVRVLLANKLVVVRRTLTAEQIQACETAVWPSSQADPYAVRTIGIDYQQTPQLDRYLWSGQPPGLLLMQAILDEEESQEANPALLAAYPHFIGRGCVIVPPPEATAGSNFLFAFLDAQGQPLSEEWAKLFPWLTTSVDGVTGEMPHLGFTAVATPHLQPQPTTVFTQTWANNLTFLGYHLPQTVYQPGETVNLTLYYRVDGPIDNSYSAFTHLLGSAFNPATGGPLWGQQDGNPCGDFYAMADWQPGTTIMSKVIIPVTADTPPGMYELRTGFYNWLNGERVALADGSGDGISLGFIEVQN
jgi:arabinofuranosyltransferase